MLPGQADSGTIIDLRFHTNITQLFLKISFSTCSQHGCRQLRMRSRHNTSRIPHTHSPTATSAHHNRGEFQIPSHSSKRRTLFESLEQVFLNFKKVGYTPRVCLFIYIHLQRTPAVTVERPLGAQRRHRRSMEPATVVGGLGRPRPPHFVSGPTQEKHWKKKSVAFFLSFFLSFLSLKYI